MNALSQKFHNLSTSIKLLFNLLKNTNRHMKVKKDREYSHIDFENGIVHGKLLQIRNSAKGWTESGDPILKPVWCCNIPASLSKPFLMFIREFITPFDPNSFHHVKRFEKIDTHSKQVILKAIVCSHEFMNDENQLQSYMKANLEQNELTRNLSLYSAMLPSLQPQTKEIAQEWSEKYWPTSWKGNPYHQELKSSNIVLHQEEEVMKKLISATRGAPPSTPGVTIIARECPGKDMHEILGVFYDNRERSFLQHSVMSAIAGIAENEKNRRSKEGKARGSGYLCQDLLVYSTYEPCVMCCMALVHSRIARITYIIPSPLTGGLESHYQLGDRSSLNWRFKIWRWIGQSEIQEVHDMKHKYEKENFHV